MNVLTYGVNSSDPTLTPDHDQFNLGPMMPGVSRPVDNLTASALPYPLNVDFVAPQAGVDPGGAMIKVQHTADSVTNGTAASRTYNLAIPFSLAEVETAVAQLIFDLPSATIITGRNPMQLEWAVGLVFKNGNRDDLDADVKVGVVCHFTGAGYFLRGTEASTVPLPCNYDDLKTNRTSFELRVHLTRTLTAGAGIGTLRVSDETGNTVGNTITQGNMIAGLFAAPPPIDLMPTAESFTQVGFVVASQSASNLNQFVQARIQSFRLWINPNLAFFRF